MSDFAPKEHEYAVVDWESGGMVHNWKNHVPEYIRENWHQFNTYQRSLLHKWAEELAHGEEWD